MVLDYVISLRCDKDTKEFFEGMAEARGTTVSKLVFGLLSDGARMERERRERLRKQYQDRVKAIDVCMS